MLEEEIDVDALLEDLKMNCGKFYPTGAYFLLLYNIMIVMADVFTMSFTAWVPKDLLPNMKSSYPDHHIDEFPYICNSTLRSSLSDENASNFYPEIANHSDKSVMAQFLLVCKGNELYVNLTNTIFLVGIIVASFVSMPIADAIGRKPVLFAR
jgi:MFS family permease